MNWRLVFTRQALKDAKKLSAAGLRSKAEALLKLIQVDPFKVPPPYEKLIGDLAGKYSRRVNIQRRLVYEVFSSIRTIKVIRLWTHYE